MIKNVPIRTGYKPVSAAWRGALIFKGAGKKIAFAERDLTGGTCTNYGCNAKALLDGPAELVSALERYKEPGVTATLPEK